MRSLVVFKSNGLDINLSQIDIFSQACMHFSTLTVQLDACPIQFMKISKVTRTAKGCYSFKSYQTKHVISY